MTIFMRKIHYPLQQSIRTCNAREKKEMFMISDIKTP